MSEYVPYIGTGFGTSNSSMAWYDPRTGDAEVILKAEGQPKTPSLVHSGESETLVGKPVGVVIEEILDDREMRREGVFRRPVSSIERDSIALPGTALPGSHHVQPVDVADRNVAGTKEVRGGIR